MAPQLGINELLEKTIETYCPLIHKKNLKILDAMCGFWSYSKTLLNYFSKKYELNLLMGVEKEIYDKDFPKIFQKPLEYKNSLIEDLPKSYDDSFDIVTNFRPMCTSKKLVDELRPAYKRIKQLMKKDGIFFATTFNNYEIDNLILLLNNNGFKINSVKRNNFDLSEIFHGWIVVAKP